MGLWHGVQHYQFMKISEESDTELYFNSWPEILANNYEYRYDWSYIVSWVGVGMTLLSSILFALAALCIKNDRETEDAMNLQYLMPGNTNVWNIIEVPEFLRSPIPFRNLPMTLEF